MESKKDRTLRDSSPQLELMRLWMSLLQVKGVGNFETLRRRAKNRRVSLTMHRCLHKWVSLILLLLLVLFGFQGLTVFEGFWSLNPKKQNQTTAGDGREIMVRTFFFSFFKLACHLGWPPRNTHLKFLGLKMKRPCWFLRAWEGNQTKMVN